MPRHGEEPFRGIDLDLVLPAVGNFSLDDDVYAGAAGRNFGVAVEVTDYLHGPYRHLAGPGVYAAVQVDAGERIAAREHEAHPGVAAALVSSQGLLERTPGPQAG